MDVNVLPNVSVVIVVYNGQKYIKDLLMSLADQSYPTDKMEVLVFDNASTDNTGLIVKEQFRNVRYINLGKNYGFTGGSNRAFGYAKHDFLAFLNVDTVCHREWLLSLVSALVKDNAVGACCSNVVSMECEEFSDMEKNVPLRNLYGFELTAFGFAQPIKRQSKSLVCTRLLSGCSFLIRREVVGELGYLFDEEFWIYAEDTDLSLRIHNLGRKIYAVKDSAVYHIHRSYIKLSANKVRIVAKAIVNRVLAFYKSMGGFEFILYFPFLFFGGPLKLFTLSLNPIKKIIYFLPFSLFSMGCMLSAVFLFPKYALRRRFILERRKVKAFTILKLMLKSKEIESCHG